MTTDTKAAEKFYCDVIGWSAADSGMPGGSYTLFSAGKDRVGGLMPIPEDARAMGAKPGWMGYIAVPDVDDYAKRVKAAGGSIKRPPTDIPGVGRFAVVGDLHGAGFMLFKGDGEAPGALGHIGWHELHAGDGKAAWDFYSGLFGWTKKDALDMGSMGVYQLFATGGEAVGGMMTKMTDTPEAHWLFYFNVDGIDAAAARTTKADGKVLMGPHQVPTGQWIVQCTDPQGAEFAMLATKR
jgi:predicted enzyme related to lactoylglutathione lyase